LTKHSKNFIKRIHINKSTHNFVCAFLLVILLAPEKGVVF
jgi:hypothetical protein